VTDDTPDQYDDALLPGDGRWTCCGFPVQAEGSLEDGRMWYFRERHGEWRFDVSHHPADDVKEALGNTQAGGESPFDGVMPQHIAGPIITALVAVQNARSEP
jgi:hypothetical protein